MVAVLNRTLFKPINRILAEREQRTEGGLSEADSIVASVQEKVRGYEQKLREARTSGYELLEQQRMQALREREQKIGSLKTEIESWVRTEKRELAIQSEDARRFLQDRTRELGVEIASRVLERPVSQ
jgi:F-type H+-transporting ATPase subunit b